MREEIRDVKGKNRKGKREENDFCVGFFEVVLNFSRESEYYCVFFYVFIVAFKCVY